MTKYVETSLEVWTSPHSAIGCKKKNPFIHSGNLVWTDFGKTISHKFSVHQKTNSKMQLFAIRCFRVALFSEAVLWQRHITSDHTCGLCHAAPLEWMATRSAPLISWDTLAALRTLFKCNKWPFLGGGKKSETTQLEESVLHLCCPTSPLRALFASHQLRGL